MVFDARNFLAIRHLFNSLLQIKKFKWQCTGKRVYSMDDFQSKYKGWFQLISCLDIRGALGWPKSSLGSSVMSYGKTWTNFLANPIFINILCAFDSGMELLLNWKWVEEVREPLITSLEKPSLNCLNQGAWVSCCDTLRRRKCRIVTVDFDILQRIHNLIWSQGNIR